ncbi:MAG: helix-hairpin-helix domain-containing protein [Clostridia bacterium]|nr:helix-hairpin-helix domain-containing protein [Clostridia bacterium]
MTLVGTWWLVEDKKTYDASMHTSAPKNEKFSLTEEIISEDSEINIINDSDKLDINTATKEELTTLEGIGPVLAGRIIEFRNERPFKTIYDLKKVSGIGDKIFKDIEAYITVNRQ